MVRSNQIPSLNVCKHRVNRGRGRVLSGRSRGVAESEASRLCFDGCLFREADAEESCYKSRVISVKNPAFPTKAISIMW